MWENGVWVPVEDLDDEDTMDEWYDEADEGEFLSELAGF